MGESIIRFSLNVQISISDVSDRKSNRINPAAKIIIKIRIVRSTIGALNKSPGVDSGEIM